MENQEVTLRSNDSSYTTRPTPCGCWAILTTAKRTQKQFFRQTQYGNAKTKAETWIAEQKQARQEVQELEAHLFKIEAANHDN